MMDYDIRLTAVHGGEIRYPPGSTLGPRLQPSLQFVFLHSGAMTVWIDHVRYEIPVQSVTVLFPGHREHFVFAADTITHHSWVHLHFDSYPQALMQRLARLPRSLSLSQDMHETIRAILTLKGSSLTTAEALTRALAWQVLWRFIGEGERQQDAPSLYTVEQARRFIHAHLASPLTLKQIAEAVNVSPTHLIRLFQAQQGVTPIAYVWQQRMALGLELLRETGLSIGQIAAQCGFQSSHHFSRRIRQSFGATASDLRIQARALTMGTVDESGALTR